MSGWREVGPSAALSLCAGAEPGINVSLYIDTSCLFKLLWQELETSRTEEIVSSEPTVLVSSLARLEMTVQIHERRMGGALTKSAVVCLLGQMQRLFASEPFEFRTCPAGLVELAEKQIRHLEKGSYCRTMDRLHLAAAIELGARRLLTNDDAQARAARSAGLQVLMPR